MVNYDEREGSYKISENIHCECSNVDIVCVKYSFGFFSRIKEVTSETKAEIISKILNQLADIFFNLNTEKELNFYLNHPSLFEERIGYLSLIQDVACHIDKLNKNFGSLMDDRIFKMAYVEDVLNYKRSLNFELLDLSNCISKKYNERWLWGNVSNSKLERSISRSLGLPNSNILFPSYDKIDKNSPIDIAFCVWVVSFFGEYCDEYQANEEGQKDIIGIDFRDKSMPFSKELVLKSMDIVEDRIDHIREFHTYYGINQEDYLKAIKTLRNQLNMFEVLNNNKI